MVIVVELFFLGVYIILIVILSKRYKIISKIILLTALVLLQKHIVKVHWFLHFLQLITVCVIVLRGENKFKQVDRFPHGVKLLVHLDVCVWFSHWGVELDDCALLEFFVSEDPSGEEDLEEWIWSFVDEFLKFKGLA